MTDAPPTDTLAASRKRQRTRMFAILGGVVAVGAVGYLGYNFFVSSHYVATDNAYAPRWPRSPRSSAAPS
jgi:membrane fusion protein (multidrug efflux system)